MAPFHQIRNLGGMILSWGPPEFVVPVIHPRRPTFAGSAGFRGRGLGSRARLGNYQLLGA